MKRLIICLFALLSLLCGCTAEAGQSAQNDVDNIFLANVPVPAEVAALQPGESAQIEVGPELREYYFALVRIKDWFHLPKFAEGEQSDYPLDYWYMLLLDGAEGWDEETGWLIGDSSWQEVPDGSPYGSSGSEMIAVQDFDAWVQARFGDVKLQHQVDTGKYYDFDGEYYYGWAGGSIPALYYELVELTAENRDGQIVYTALLNDYAFNEYNFFHANKELTLEENLAEYENVLLYANEADKLVYTVYKEQLLSGEISMDEAIRQMIVAGRTEGFPLCRQIRVKYYLNQQTGEPFYLQVEEMLVDN
ncbi:MAG: hypothetical protein HFJ96_06995 [Peptococcaceae bacterium]|jgi:hypothetical protein|nr:hypothetical protein [Peptococcaceae bacterium]